MEIRLSENLQSLVPTFKEEILTTAKLATELDRDIILRGLFITARCATDYGRLSGTAWPRTYTFVRRIAHYIDHKPGKITLSIGIDSDPLDRIAIVAHELRHIGQFHRGRLLHGFFGAEYLGRDCEPDAREFETTVLDRL